MSDKKISVVLLVKEDSLKKSLITIILGKDLSKLIKTSVLTKTDIYENDIYKFACTPDLHTESDDIKDLYVINQNPDMSVLVIEDGLSTEEVSNQIEKLHETTGKHKEEFRLVMSNSCTHSHSYPVKSYTVEQFFSKLRKLAEKRHLVSTKKRRADQTESNKSTRQASIVSGMHADAPVNLVLVGKSGTGKSASGNTILQETKFFSKASSQPVTRECQEAETEIDGKSVRVIDTPDVFDDHIIKSSVKKKHLKKCKELCRSGPCVFVLVMQVSRFTDGERGIMKKLKRAFGKRVKQQTVILFTRGEDLQRTGMSLEDFLSSCQPDLKKIVEKCENRCVVFENRTSDSHQVKELMQKVENVLEKHKKLCT